jgi:transcriptional regulator with XRE-family HTH domain
VLPPEISEKQIAKLLGEMHVGGKNAWSPFEKAAHVHKLHEEHGLTQEEIARLLRTSKSAVNHNIRAFNVMKSYLERFGGDGAVRKFSYFVELFKKPELRTWATNDTEAIELFSEWVGTGKIARGEHVRELRDIVTNSRALGAFKEQGREAAKRVLELDRPELTSPLFKAMTELTKALDLAKLDDIQRVRKEPAARKVVRKLHDSFSRFVDLCGGAE